MGNKMEINGDFIVVKVVKGGGGLISPAFSEKYALEHFRQWKENLKESETEGFVKIFDVRGNEYKVTKDSFLNDVLEFDAGQIHFLDIQNGFTAP